MRTAGITHARRSSKQSERERLHVIISSTNQNVVYIVNTNREKSTILKARVDHSLLRLVVLNKTFRLKVYFAMEQGKRFRISDNQKCILERFYQRGMVGVGKTYLEMIGNAVQDTGLTTTQVKV